MPMDNMMDGAMDDSYSAPVKPPKESAGQTDTVDQEDGEAQTALISNKILSPDGEPIKEGDEIVLQVVKNYGDESEVKYAPHKPGEGEGGETESTETPDAELAAMDKSGGGY